MVVTVFRARARKDLEPQVLQEYEKRNNRMLKLGSAMPGFISYKDFSAPDGEALTIVEFETLDDAGAWRKHPEHREVQQWGRDFVFESYCIQTCEVARTMRFPS
jgi:heme-degrading monooxygenase HmoA